MATSWAPDWSGPAWRVAPGLLGWTLCAADGGRWRIVEVEAYGPFDAASHAWRGRNRANAAMFGPPATWYAYRSYGIHTCINVVCGPEGVGSAVLLRAAEPLTRDSARANGPGLLGRAVGATVGLSGTDALRPQGTPWLEPGVAPTDIARGPRIGISRAAQTPWRFWDPASPHVSRYRRLPPSRSGGQVSGVAD